MRTWALRENTIVRGLMRFLGSLTIVELGALTATCVVLMLISPPAFVAPVVVLGASFASLVAMAALSDWLTN